MTDDLAMIVSSGLRGVATDRSVSGERADEKAVPIEASFVVDESMRAAIEFSPLGTILLDAFGKVLFANDAALEFLGLPVDELVGSSMTNLVHPDDRTIDMESLDALARGEVRSLTNEWRLIASAGTPTWMRTHLSRVRARGSAARYVVQLEDITERRRLEERLTRNEHMARVTLDALEEGVLLADSSGEVHRMNPAAERMLGFTVDELTDRWQRREWDTYDESGRLMPIEQRPLYRAAVLGERVSDERVMWRRASGEPMLVRVSCIPGEHGMGMNGGRAMVITFTDITDARRTERLLEATLETAPAGLAVVDAVRGSIIHCNPAFAEQVGRSVSDLVDTDLFELLQPGDRNEVQEWAASMLNGTSSTGQREQVVDRPDGTVATLHATLALIDHLEEPVFIAATFDMTETRAMESALSRFAYMFERTNDLISVIDLQGTVLYATPSHQRALGIDTAIHAGADVFAYLHPDDIELCRSQVFALLDGAESAGPFRVRLRAESGQYHQLETVAVNLLDEPSVSGIVFTSRDVTEREQLMEQLAHRAAHDLLTELPNRMLFESRLREALARTERSGGHVGLCYIDLDDFKAVNDTRGHPAGDSVLVEVAERLRAVTRDGDTAARIGGDEFVVVLDPVTDIDDARRAAARIRDALVDPPIVVCDGVRFGASVGVAISRLGEDADRLQSRADSALYRAKALQNSSVAVSPSNV